LKLPFHKLTDSAAQAVRGAYLPATFKTTVLFDAFYLCPTVVNACKEKGWHYIGVGKSNLGSDLDQLLTQRSQRPFLHRLGQIPANIAFSAVIFLTTPHLVW